MDGTVTALVASYAPDAGAVTAPAYVRLAELADALPDRRLVLRNAAWPVVLFDDPTAAVAAARVLREQAAAIPAGQLLRIAVHTGVAQQAAVRHAEQVNEVANPGQTLLTSLAAEAVDDPVDLGVHRLRDLGAGERLFALPEGGLEAPRSLARTANNLPVMFTSFVGRRAELGAITTQLASSRLMTLSGPGGTGKTRLAAQVAAGSAQRWPDGVWWIDLAAVTDGGLLPELVASTIGVPVGDVRLLAGQLRERKLLLCLDNCEHLLDPVAELVIALQSSCPEITVLTTSREPLDIPGEVVRRVPPLTVSEGPELFAERAGDAFVADEVDAEAIWSICRRLDGIPLAIELAASWLRTLTPRQIEAGLDDRFGLLVRNTRGVAARQQTLAASIDWSYDLLDDSERKVFRRLAVFSGGFTLAATQAVCDDPAVLETLGRLVDKSLVVAEEERYRLLETIREYAGTRLAESGELEQVRDLHLDYFLHVAEAAEPLLDENRDAWRAVIEPDRDNYRAALEHGLADDGGTEQGRRLAAALPWLWNLGATGPEGIGYLRRAIGSAPDDRSLLQARLLYGYATVADTASPFEFDAAERGLELATELGDDRLRARCLVMVAVGKIFTDLQQAWDYAGEGAQLAESIGDDSARDANLALRCQLLVMWDRHEEARPLLELAAAGLLARGERGIAASVLTLLSGSQAATGELLPAIATAEQTLAVAEPLGDFHRVGMARAQLAMLLGRSGRIDAGLALLEPFVRLVAEAGAVVPGLRYAMGELQLCAGEFESAIGWLRQDTPTEGPIAETYVPAMMLPALGTALRGAGRAEESAAVLDRAVRLSRRFTLPRPLADALEQQGYLAMEADPDKAADLFHEALTLRVDHGLRLYWPDSLKALTALAEHTNRPLDTTRLAELSLDEAVAYVRRTRGSRGRPSTGWASLTPTEREVVALAVEGLSNPEISARLYMSRGTVKTHLAHVYAKLNVANRTELAALAATRPD
ncbi:helix-turn-helix transcriptional regulator [Kribbella monticola]|uniref:helix-turn-helix transcriptional regulator n=1 Tax=Kribbella monticola TaxID=2185285 RepID=UPI0013008397|nr:LuxR C-terminal-related transcriptional regulator [Kribbella monticola]